MEERVRRERSCSGLFAILEERGKRREGKDWRREKERGRGREERKKGKDVVGGRN
ncbi:hypothetical protein Fmac_012579 [Flemingia macrophylla]|uniref:Uncharacterized protein n=1 Tax=Flemingia macrophylla TaxID=520843 RepID=A0ABD1MRK7_9FABA